MSLHQTLADLHQEKVAGYKMTIEEKVKIIKDRIQVLEIHVPVLERDILDNPDGDHPDKPSRSSVLQDIKNSIQALKDLEESLTSQS